MDRPDLVMDAGLVLGFLLTPLVLVWPVAYGRLLIPPVIRHRVAERPLTWAAAVAVPLAVLAGASASVWLLGGLVHVSPDVNRVQAIALVWLIFGGSTAFAFFRAVVIRARRWRLTGGTGAGAGAASWSDGLSAVDVDAVKALAVRGQTEGPLDRSAMHRVDRRLRGWSRWLAAVGLLWYFFGRVLQAVGLGGGDGSDAPGWWWWVTLTLAGLGVGVWLTRCARRSWSGRADPNSPHLASVPALLDAWGFSVVQPGGEWLRDEVPGVFFPADVVIGPSLWPWAGVGLVGDRAMVMAQQQGQIRNRTGLTFGQTRTVCVVRVPEANLPVVMITGREAVPPALLGRSINLELVSFNRALWAWGPDPRGFHAVVHPLTMSDILQGLPDGASLMFGRDQIALYCDEPVPTARIADYVWLACRLADAVPTYLIERNPAS
jgi:hypothetical protein